jgi:urea transporter
MTTNAPHAATLGPGGLGERIATTEATIPEPFRRTLRGVGQVFFQESALTGACFLVGIAVNAPIMALGGLVGAALGTAVARLAKFDPDETAAGIHGFNATLVGISTFFFFQPGPASVAMMAVGAVVATLLTRLMRGTLPFPTYTTPFIVTTWAIWLIGPALGAAWVPAGDPYTGSDPFVGIANGVGQVMFQANLVTAVLFVVGIALSDWRHAVLVVAASALGVAAANYHVTPAQRALDPEQLVPRFLTQNITLGLYSYNATLAALALFLWRKSLIPALLGAMLSTPLTEFAPMTGLPALTAPFVAATWLVLLVGFIDVRFLHGPPTAPDQGESPPPSG